MTATVTMSKILAPVDFSSASAASVNYATALAKTLHSVVTLLHVNQTPDLMEAIVPGEDRAADVAKDRAFARERLEKCVRETPGHAGVETRVVVVRGSPAQEIISFSRKGGFDMIVMGTHGRTGLRRVLMGSVAEAVVRRAQCPVLTIHLPFSDPSQPPPAKQPA
jgi:universal stress protein A